MLPMLRQTNNSPGLVCVISSGTTRLSAQAMKSVCGSCPVARSVNSCLRCGNAFSRKLRTPSHQPAHVAPGRLDQRRRHQPGVHGTTLATLIRFNFAHRTAPLLGVALFLPGIAAVVIAADFPEARLVGGRELDPLQPLGAFPEIQMGHDQPHRTAMLGRRAARPFQLNAPESRPPRRSRRAAGWWCSRRGCATRRRLAAWRGGAPRPAAYGWIRPPMRCRSATRWLRSGCRSPPVVCGCAWKPGQSHVTASSTAPNTRSDQRAGSISRMHAEVQDRPILHQVLAGRQALLPWASGDVAR